MHTKEGWGVERRIYHATYFFRTDIQAVGRRYNRVAPSASDEQTTDRSGHFRTIFRKCSYSLSKYLAGVFSPKKRPGTGTREADVATFYM